MLESKLQAFFASVGVFFLIVVIMVLLGYTYEDNFTKVVVIGATFGSYSYLKPKNKDKED